MFEIFKSTLNKVKNNEEKIEKDEVKAVSSIVSLLVEAASIDGQIGDDEKNKISSILINQLKLDPIKAKEILDEKISLSGDQIEIWSKTSDIRKNAKRVFLSILNHRVFAAFKKRIALG